MFNKNKGFTIIELIVVIAIIAVLAAIVLTNVSGYINRAKEARASDDFNNIAKAIQIFYGQYGMYPGGDPQSQEIEFYSSSDNGGGEPCSTVNGQQHCLSEFYKSDWTGYNANYYINNGYYHVHLWDENQSGKADCGVVRLDSGGYSYGWKYILCTGCPCGTNGYTDMSPQFTPLNFNDYND